MLFDLQLPDFDGDELLVQLKGDEHMRRIPVIMVSADATVSQVNRVQTLGAEDFLTNPISVATSLRTIEGALV